MTHEFMAEGKRPLGPFGTRDDYVHLLGFLDDVKKLVDVGLADPGEQLKAETATDHSGSGQHALIILVEPLQSAADDQAHVFRNVDLVDRNVSAKIAGSVIDFSILEQMPVQLLDEERISLACIKDETRKTFRNLALA